MEAAGLAFALVDFVSKLAKFGSKIKDAPKVWHQYSAALNGVSHLYVIVREVAKEAPFDTVAVDVDGQQQQLMALCNTNVKKVTKDARTLLKGFEKITARQLWKRLWHQLRFAVDQDRIQDLLRTVECAKSTLLLTISIAGLKTTRLGHEVMERAARGLKEQIAAQSEILKDLRNIPHRLRAVRRVREERSSRSPSSRKSRQEQSSLGTQQSTVAD
ncbi:hypothetical protein ACHAPT_004272 [Fusarium lateritium]